MVQSHSVHSTAPRKLFRAGLEIPGATQERKQDAPMTLGSLCGVVLNMPANYDATARSLAIPISSPRSPKGSNQLPRTSWSRQRSSQSVPRNQPSSQGRLRDRVIDRIERIRRHSLSLAKKLSPLQRIAAGVAVVTALALTILFFIFNEQIFAWLEPIAVKWKNLRGGWLILWAMTFMTAFPPMIGYSTSVTIAGFVYGLPIGWDSRPG